MSEDSRFEDLDIDGNEPSLPKKSKLTVNQIAEWLWENQYQQFHINPKGPRSDGLVELHPKMVKFQRTWKLTKY